MFTVRKGVEVLVMFRQESGMMAESINPNWPYQNAINWSLPQSQRNAQIHGSANDEVAYTKRETAEIIFMNPSGDRVGEVLARISDAFAIQFIGWNQWNMGNPYAPRNLFGNSGAGQKN